MKLFSKVLFAVAVLGATIIGMTRITVSSPAKVAHVAGSFLRIRDLNGLSLELYLQGIIEHFTQTRCQPLCVGIVNTFISPSNCAAVCDEEEGRLKRKCMHDCHDVLSAARDYVGGPGSFCSQTVCHFLDKLVNERTSVHLKDSRLGPGLVLALSGEMELVER